MSIMDGVMAGRLTFAGSFATDAEQRLTPRSFDSLHFPSSLLKRMSRPGVR